MSIAVLTQVYDEVRRLSIAGSVVAGGDFRLKKLVPPLEKAGEKAPVFAKVAQGVTKVVDSNERNSAEALLELSSLVNAILYTQGETGQAGDLKPIVTNNLGGEQTQTTARVLKPLLEALTTTGSGRVEIIKDAHQRNVFKDLRLVKPALGALDDPYPEIAEFIAKKVLPLYGQAILPELKAKFDQKGKGGHVRRLTLMHELDPVGSREIVKEALENGSKEMKVVAIECLGDSPEDLSFLLEQAKAKAKDVRTAAFKAIAKIDTGDAITLLHGVIKGNDIDLAVEPIRKSRNPKILEIVLAEAKAQWDGLFGVKGSKDKDKDKKEAGKRIDRMNSLLECLRERDDKDSEAFLLACFADRERLLDLKGEPLSGADVRQKLIGLVAHGSSKMRKALVVEHASLNPEELQDAFYAARRSLKAAEVYDKFSPYLAAKVDEKKKSRDPAFAKREAIQESLQYGWRYRHYYMDWDDADDDDGEEEKATKELDPRWLDLAVTQKNMELVFALARPNHPAANELLLTISEQQLSKSKDAHETSSTLQTMVRVQHPEATRLVIAAIKKFSASTNSHWAIYWLARLVGQLPKSALPELEALLPTLPEKVIDQVLDYVTVLKNRS
jgi:hypothetical protein